MNKNLKFFQPKRFSERGLVLILLPFPFIVAWFMMSFMREPDLPAPGPGEPYVYTNLFIYSYSGLCLVYLPAFIVGYLWFLWKSKSRKDFIGKPLFQMPVIISFLMLYTLAPICMIPNITLLLIAQTTVFIFLSCLIVSYLWIGLVKCLTAITYNCLHQSGK